jgi:hypothetical protein
VKLQSFALKWWNPEEPWFFAYPPYVNWRNHADFADKSAAAGVFASGEGGNMPLVRGGVSGFVTGKDSAIRMNRETGR